MPEKRHRIYAMKNGTFNTEDRVNIAALLAKAGYCVKIGKEKPKSTWIYFVEFWEEQS